jgi:hypothetical protein
MESRWRQAVPVNDVEQVLSQRRTYRDESAPQEGNIPFLRAGRARTRGLFGSIGLMAVHS